MAEPARDPYDDSNSEEPVTRPDLRALEGGGESTPRGRGHLRAADGGNADESESDEPTSARDRANKTWGIEPAEVKDAEEAAESGQSTEGTDKEASVLNGSEDQVGEGFNPDDKKKSRFSRLRGSSAQKKWLLGAGGAGVVGIILAGFMALLPFKVNSIIENLQNKFFAVPQSVVQKRAELYLSRYFTQHVIPSLDKGGLCSSTRTMDRNCIDAVQGDSLADKFFRAMRDGRVESQLANKYGIEFAKQGNNYYLRVDSTKSSLNIDGFRKNPDGLWQAMGEKHDIRVAFNKAIENETFWKRMMMRFKVGSLMQRKYSIPLCLFACDYTQEKADQFSSWKDKKTEAAKLSIIRRVVQPHAEVTGLALECIISSDCKIDAKPDATDHERRTALEDKIKQHLDQIGVDLGTDSAEKIAKVAKIADSIGENGGLSGYIIDTILEKTIQSEAIKAGVSKGIPIIGWIDMGAKVVSTIHNVGPVIKRAAFVINAGSMIKLYMMYRSNVDECKSGRCDAEMYGSMAKQLGSEAGGKGQPAEISPLYSEELSSGRSPPTALLDLLSPTAYAQSANLTSDKPIYTCDSGQPIGVGQFICPEESLLTDNFFTQLTTIMDKPPLDVLTNSADLWNNSVGQILGLLGTAVGPLAGAADSLVEQTIPWYKSVKDAVNSGLATMFNGIATWFIPSPISDNMSGARTGNMLIGGADAAGNDYSHYGLGGKRLSDQQVVEIRNEQSQQDKEEFDSKPLFARLFDSEDANSLVSRVAMDMPTNASAGIQSSIASLASNPFSKIFHNFGALLSNSKVIAATAKPDPFGIPQYGYPLDDPALSTDPSTLTPDYCAKLTTAWENDVHVDPATGMDEHDSVNPCLLDEAVLGSFGGRYDDTLLGNDVTAFRNDKLTGQSPLATKNDQSFYQRIVSSFSFLKNSQTSDSGNF